MTRLNYLLCIAIVLVPHITLIAAERDSETKAATTKPSRTASPRPGLRGEYALIATQAELTDKQRIQLAEIAMEQRNAEDRMRSVNQKRIAGLQKDLANARKANNVDAISTILQQIMRINATEAKAKKAFTARVMELLQPEQKAKWTGFTLCRSVCGTLLKAKLTDDQKNAIRELCNDAALELGDDGLKTAIKRYAAQKKLRDKVKAEILTDDQRKALGGRPTKPVRSVKKPVLPVKKSVMPPKKPVKKPPAKRR